MSKQRAKGTAFETSIVRYLQQWWPYAERRALHGGADQGDITGTPGIVWECKNHNTLKLSEWLRETETERENARAKVGVLIAKRRGVADPGEQYAVVPLRVMAQLLKDAGW